MINKINLYDKIIPKGTKVEILFTIGTPGGTISSSVVQPNEDGYKLCLSYLVLTVPPEVQANVIAKTEKGEFPLISDQIIDDTVILDKSDFNNLDYLDSITLVASTTTTTTTTTADRKVTLEFGGKLVIPYI